MIEQVLADVRYALRGMSRQPGPTAVAVLTLALGIGANTAVFSVLRAVLLRPLPFESVDRVVRVAESGFDELDFRQTSMPNYLDWRENTVFSAMAGYWGGGSIDTGREFAERVVLGRVTPDFFSVLGIRPMLGRPFRPEEATNGAAVVVLSHAYWLRAFGGDSAAVGSQVLLDGNPFTVVGVMGPEVGEIPPFTMELLTPMADAPRDLWQRRVRFLYVVARLKPGVTLEQARLELGTIGKRLATDYPDANEGRRVVVAPMIDALAGEVRTPLLLITGAVGMVLLIACANVANLLLARATARAAEFALRAALGASRIRLLRQVLTESSLLALLGGAVGLALAVGVQRLLLVIGPHDIPRLADTSLDGNVLLMTLGVSVVSALGFGLVPALRASVASPHTFERSAARSGPRSGSSRLLVASEVALALVLLIGGGLFVSSFLTLIRVNPGYDASNVLTMRMTLPRSRHPDAESWIAFYSQLTDRIRGMAGVRSASVSALPVLANGFFNADITVDGSSDVIKGTIWRVMPDYFRTLRIDLLAGRTFQSSDGMRNAPVAILGASSAKRLFGDADPIGRRVTFISHLRPDEGPRQVVGIVGDVRSFGLDQEVPVQLYVPFAQWAGTVGNLAVRVVGEPSSFVPAVRREIAAIDDNLPIQNIAALEDRLSESVSRPRFYTIFLAAFAVVAVLLAAVGVYGVLSYAVSQRAREMGIRMALGARGADVLRLVVRDAMLSTLAGVTVGLVIALAASRVLQSQLFNVNASDPRVAALGVLTVVAVAFIACVIPARRAGRVDPVVTLKAE